MVKKFKSYYSQTVIHYLTLLIAKIPFFALGIAKKHHPQHLVYSYSVGPLSLQLHLINIVKTGNFGSCSDIHQSDCFKRFFHLLLSLKHFFLIEQGLKFMILDFALK